MHDLTQHELDAQLAEELPARELMQFAVGAAAANLASVDQSSGLVIGAHNTITQTSDISQTATAHNTGDVISVGL